MVAEGKVRLRGELMASRRTVPDCVRRTESQQISAHLAAAIDGATTVCAYVPMGTEPGSPEILDTLARRCATVLLPVALIEADGTPLPLQWGRYVPGQLAEGRFGSQEPTGPRLPASAVATADVVLVPALAVDRNGVRLGRGGGFYDRSLPLCAPGARLVAVVRDSELLEEVPGEPHDVRVTHVLTPGSGLVRLGNARHANGGSST
jgi:5-formyltetrahydrofolate cyclo-ligase